MLQRLRKSRRTHSLLIFRLPGFPRDQGICPVKLRKAAEVAICREQFATVLQRQCGKVHVNSQVAGGATVAEQTTKQAPVLNRRVHYTHLGQCQPAVDDAERL